jgi:hypothetical protein
MKRTFMVIIIFCMVVTAVCACDIEYTVKTVEGEMVKSVKGSPVELLNGEEYILEVEYTEDHRNCRVKPEETMFLVNGIPWQPDKASISLVLKESITWTQPSNRVNKSEIHFTATSSGTATLEIIRECTKGGDKETLVFTII